MTVTTTTNKILYTGDGVQTVFPYNFEIQKDSDLLVFLDDVLQGAGYTITGAGDPGGGDVTFDVAPADLVEVFLLRELPMTQQVDYQPYGPFPAETHENALDKLTMLVQQLQEQLTRVLTEPLPGDPDFNATLPPPEALQLLGWAQDELSIVNYPQNSLTAGQINGPLYESINIVPVAANDITVNAALGNVHLAFMNEDKLLTTTGWPTGGNLQALTLLVTSQGTGHTMTYAADMVGRDGTVGTLPDTTGLLSDDTIVLTMTKLPNGSVVVDTYATNVGIIP